MRTTEQGSLSIETFGRDVTTHTVDGESTQPHTFVRLRIEMGASGQLVVELDAGEFSRLLARPRSITPVALGLGREPSVRAG